MQKFPPRIMCIEFKGDGLHGSARIGRVTFSRTGATLHYAGKEFVVVDNEAAERNEVDAGIGFVTRARL